MLEVSRGTIPRRIKAYGLDDFTRMTFSKLTNDELDQKVGDYILQHGATSGQVCIAGYLRSLGLRVQRRRVRRCIASREEDFFPYKDRLSSSLRSKVIRLAAGIVMIAILGKQNVDYMTGKRNTPKR